MSRCERHGSSAHGPLAKSEEFLEEPQEQMPGPVRRVRGRLCVGLGFGLEADLANKTLQEQMQITSGKPMQPCLLKHSKTHETT